MSKLDKILENIMINNISVVYFIIIAMIIIIMLKSIWDNKIYEIGYLGLIISIQLVLYRHIKKW